MKTIYQLAQDAMNIEIKRYLNLLTLSNGLENMREEYFKDWKSPWKELSVI